jgi:mono/diheme cytochrome c family protein
LHTNLYIALSGLGLLLGLAGGCSDSADSQPRPLSAQEARGQRLYQSTCATCHRPDSTAPLNGPGMKDLFKKAYLPSGAPANDERVGEVIRMGRKNMPPYGQVFDDSQIRAIIAYLKTL